MRKSAVGIVLRWSVLAILRNFRVVRNRAFSRSVGILDSKTEKTMFTGLNIAPTIADLEPLDALIITDAVNPQKHSTICWSRSFDRILTLPVLGILRDAPAESEQTQ